MNPRARITARRRRVAMALVTGAAIAVPAVAGCGSAGGPAPGPESVAGTTVMTMGTTTAMATATTTGPVSVTSPWVRVTPEGATTTAAYMDITSREGDALVGVSVPVSVAAAAGLHETAMEHDSGGMTMDPVARVPLPAGERVSLEPGGNHVMIMDLTTPIVRGTEVPVTLIFESGVRMTVMAVAEDP